MKTKLSVDLDTASEKAQYNAHCKNLLSNRHILAWILREAVEEFQSCTLEEIVDRCLAEDSEVSCEPVFYAREPENIHTRQNVNEIPGEGQITYDIRFCARVPVNGREIVLYMNLEAQKKYNPGYPLIKRGIFYCARMLSSQYGQEFNGRDYSGIKKVYSIWICMNTPKNVENSIVSYRMEPELLAGHPVKTEKRQNYDLLNVIQIRLGTEPENSSPLLQLLGVLFSAEIKAAEKKHLLAEKFGLPMETGVGKEIGLMCNLADLVEEKGIEKGIEKGLERGMQAFILDNIEDGFSPSRIIEKLQKSFSLTRDEAEEYYERLSTESF